MACYGLLFVDVVVSCSFVVACCVLVVSLFVYVFVYLFVVCLFVCKSVFVVCC